MLLEFKKVNIKYSNKFILNNISFELNQGDFLGIIGANGSGKTTFIKSALGFIKPSSGSIKWTTNKIIKAYVPQYKKIDPIWPLSVNDLLILTIKAISPIFKKTNYTYNLDKIVELTNIKDLKAQTLDTLSGGELQRVLLARALIVEPNILFLDEPSSAMDLIANEKFLNLISYLNTEKNISIVMVTHDTCTLIDRSNKIAIIHNKNIYIGPSKELISSDNLSKIYNAPVYVKTIDKHTIISIEKQDDKL